MARVLVTRAEPGAGATARRLFAEGHEPIVSPLLVVEHIPVSLELENVQALLFTSAAGVRAAGQTRRDLRTLCVGEATARAAKTAGFVDVHAAEGDGADLAALVRRSLAPAGGPLVHLAGEDVAFDLGAALAADGFAVERRTVYRTRPAAALTDEAGEALNRHTLDAALFHSARAAEAFLALAPAGATAAIDALCLSGRIADAVAGALWRSVRVAARPSEALLLALLRSADSAQS